MNKLSFLAWSRWGFYLFFALLPFQIDALLWSADLNLSGFYNPYVTHFVYLSDVFLILSLCALGLAWLRGEPVVSRGFDLRGLDRRFLALVLGFLFFALVSVFVSVNAVNSLWHFIRLVEFAVVALLLAAGFVDFRRLLEIFVAVVSVASVIGVLQFVFQSSLGLGLFGEPLISSDMLGVAKFDFFGEKLLRVYGLFVHPNVFAVYLVFAIFSALYLLESAKRRGYFFVALAICSLALLLTFSRSAFLALLLGLAFYAHKKGGNKLFVRGLALLVVLGLSSRLIFWDGSSFDFRWDLMQASWRMFLAHPFGVGLGNFTEMLQSYFPSKLLPWSYQPVHNIFLLLLNETGMLGFIGFLSLFCYVLWGAFQKNWLLFTWGLAIVVIGSFDHYFVTLYQGQALLWLFIGYSTVIPK